jgi:hypothetical protein
VTAGKKMEQVDLFAKFSAPNTDAGVPLVKVTTCRPQISERGGGWLCLLECGHQAHVPVGPRPRSVPHICPEECTEK